MFLLLVRGGSQSVSQPGCMVDGQTPPIQNYLWALGYDWWCVLVYFYEKKIKSFALSFPWHAFCYTHLNFFSFSQYITELLMLQSRNSTRIIPLEPHSTVVFLTGSICKHYLGFLGEFVCPCSINCLLFSKFICFAQVLFPLRIELSLIIFFS